MDTESASTFGQPTDSQNDEPDSNTDTITGRLSPTTQAGIDIMMQKLHTHEARIGTDSKGRPAIQYNDAKPLHWDASNAHVIATPKSTADYKEKMDACLELVDYLKKSKCPSGVKGNNSKISIGKSRRYEEGTDFVKTKEVLGKGNMAGDIFVLKDIQTDTEHAQKVMMISVFRKEEVQAWVDLDGTGVAPELYLFRIEGNSVFIHMEILEKVVTLRKVIDDHMAVIRQANPTAVRPLSLCVFHGLLTAVQTMRERGWTHRDLHADNVLLQKESDCSIKVRIVDFGLASRIGEMGGEESFRLDIKETVRNFSGLYIGQTFGSAAVLNKPDDWMNAVAEAVDHYPVNRAERVELFNLIDSALRIVGPTGSQDLIQSLERKINKKELDKVMKEDVIPVLFPPKSLFEYQSVNPTGQSTLDSSSHQMDDDVTVADGMCTDVPVTMTPDDVLEELRLEMGIGPTKF